MVFLSCYLIVLEVTMQLAYYLCERNNEKFQLLTYLYMACVHYARISLGIIGYNDVLPSKNQALCQLNYCK